MTETPSFPRVPDCPWHVVNDDHPDVARVLRARARVGELRRIAHGRYVPVDAWDHLRPEQRHHVLVRSLIDRIRPHFVVSHLSAAAVLGVPFLHPWPGRVHLIRPGEDARTTSATFVVHADLDPTMRGTWRFRADDLRVTNSERTAVDLAMTLPFLDGVVALDRLLRLGADVQTIQDGIERRSRRGRRRALRSLAFADGAADTPGESVARVRLDEYGAPPPVTQHRFRERGHPAIVVDLWLPDLGVAIEFDGEVKYRDPALRAGASPEDIVIAEKYREDRLRAFDEVRQVVRLSWGDLWNETSFRGKLRRAQVPMRQ
ncbi:hypothetical protein [Curtobacterium sp. 1544]|uniref:hypothetical protein n=1 Tax=Curtobacterium sp. 1544 TaxID=3156417 RepID=UPI0033907CD2